MFLPFCRSVLSPLLPLNNQAGYVHSGADCVKCEESSGWNWFFLIIMLTIVFVSVVVLVRRATRANASTDWKHLTKEQRRARLLVPTLKVTISYLQVNKKAATCILR